MNVGETVRIKNTNSVFDNKIGLLEWIDEEGGTCTVFVDFVPGQDKRVRQDFSLENIESCGTDDDTDITDSITDDTPEEESEEDISQLESFLAKNHLIQ